MRKLKTKMNELKLDKRVVAELSEQEQKSYLGGTTGALCLPKPTFGDNTCSSYICTGTPCMTICGTDCEEYEA